MIDQVLQEFLKMARKGHLYRMVLSHACELCVLQEFCPKKAACTLDNFAEYFLVARLLRLLQKSYHFVWEWWHCISSDPNNFQRSFSCLLKISENVEIYFCVRRLKLNAQNDKSFKKCEFSRNIGLLMQSVDLGSREKMQGMP